MTDDGAASTTATDSADDCGCASYSKPLQWVCHLMCPLDTLGRVLAIVLLVLLFAVLIWTIWAVWAHFWSHSEDGYYASWEHAPAEYQEQVRPNRTSVASVEPLTGTASSSPSTYYRLKPETPLRPLVNPGPPIQEVSQSQTYQQERSDTPSREELNRRVDELNDRLLTIYRETSSSIGSAQEIDALAEVLRPFVAEAGVRNAQMPNTEELLLSAASFYLCGHCKKTELPAMLADVGVSAYLMLHRNIDRFLADPGATWAEFVPSDQDGCWLWNDQGGGRCLGIPIDSNVFRIPPAPLFLARLCDGVKPATELQINGVVRPCCFQQDPNSRNFQVIGKGVLQTIGSQPSAPPAGRDFPTLGSMLRPAQASGSGSLMAVLKAQASLFRDRILALERASKEYASLRDALVRAEKANSESDLRINALEVLTEKLAREAAAAPNLQSKPKQDAALGQVSDLLAATGRIQALERQLQELNERFDASISQRDKETQSYGVTSLPTALSLQKQGRIAEGPPEITSLDPSTPVVQSTDSVAPEVQPPLNQTMPGARLPDGWRPTLAAMHERADVEPGAHAVALLALVASLRKLDGTCAIHLVHAVETQRRIQIHFAIEEEDQIKCRCGVSKPFSFAVCAGEKSSGSLFVLLPAGRYSISNFPGGYSALIAGVGADSFIIQSVDTPATLQPVPGTDDQYTVSQQMQITQPR